MFVFSFSVITLRLHLSNSKMWGIKKRFIQRKNRRQLCPEFIFSENYKHRLIQFKFRFYIQYTSVFKRPTYGRSETVYAVHFDRYKVSKQKLVSAHANILVWLIFNRWPKLHPCSCQTVKSAFFCSHSQHKMSLQGYFIHRMDICGRQQSEVTLVYLSQLYCRTQQNIQNISSTNQWVDYRWMQSCRRIYFRAETIGRSTET